MLIGTQTIYESMNKGDSLTNLGGTPGTSPWNAQVSSLSYGSRMSDEDICDELITILLAGHETTATALAWALYELGRHPAVLETPKIEGDNDNMDPVNLAALRGLLAEK